MTEQAATNEQFLGLVQRFQLEAWLFMGKMVHPESQKVERNLPAAKHVIDTLGMIEEKTKGNLSSEEERFLQQVVTTLRLNFVDEANRKPGEESSTEAPPEEEGKEGAQDQPADEPKDEPEDASKEENGPDDEEKKQGADAGA
ncbi:MAG: DUF1844 domain-containing protein [Candidatus Eisenbacteria bacterium]|nr:DUF1844 domain-containing protein [Candidatus Latescibacterota bacterium]MBD3301012.1 DUF1844 domain-containing protein [Candidatus Eisenbacteria bacterium]